MNHSIYLHIPFCGHRCAYCDFNTYAGMERHISAYVEALCREVDCVAQAAPRGLCVHTIFFGGGTPSLLAPDQIARLLSTIRASFRLTDDVEISMEANPGTVSLQKLVNYRAAGVNRISLGVQSANGEELRQLERTHTFADVITAVAAVRGAGIQNLNVDLIYGLPEQGFEAWRTTVGRVMSLNPSHVSAYALTLEHGTPFGNWARRGLMATPDSDLAADMYDWITDELPRYGYAQYEISNWAQSGFECRHNLQYWQLGPYLGFGAGAHGYAGGYRYSNVLSIPAYIDRVAGSQPSVARLNAEAWSFPMSPAAMDVHKQTPEDDISEFMIMGLRLTREGVRASAFEKRFGRSLDESYGDQIQHLADGGLLDVSLIQGTECAAPPEGASAPHREFGVRLTKRGRLLGNRVFAEFVQVP